MSSDAELPHVLAALQAKARPDQLAGMARFALRGKGRLGVSMPELRKMARQIGKNHALALALWKTGIPDARILASLVDEPLEVTVQQMEEWVRDLESWDVCDQLCLNLLTRVPGAREHIPLWGRREEEFVRRAAFALIAVLAVHDDKASDEIFTGYLPLIEEASLDERNFVRKAVNWALRHIGKRNRELNREAIAAAEKLKAGGGKAARWIAADAIRELRSEAVQARLEKGKGASSGNRQAYTVYLVRCRLGTLYAGYTNDLQKRIAAHNSGKGAKYLRGRGPVELVYACEYGSPGEALRAERALKKMSREEKEALVTGYARSR